MAHQGSIQDEKVLRDIDWALSIKYLGESFEGLEQFRRDLNNLKNRITTSPISKEVQKEKSQIIEDRHLINDLFMLLERGDELDDESYNRTF